jgi:Carboxypeptidase regulatory-like domain
MVMIKQAERQIGRLFVIVFLIIATASCYAQFSASVQGTVQDSSGAAIPQAVVTLVNIDTKVTQKATSTVEGIYRFVSLPPGNYTVEGAKGGFEPKLVPFNVGTGELRNVPIILKIGSAATSVEVTTRAPLLDTSDSRNQMTLNYEELHALPNENLSPLSALDLTPGVTGQAGGQLNANSINYITISANGRGENGNSVILDGISVDDSTRYGVIDLTPNVDALQEIAVQPNTYSVQYGTASSIQIVMTTKSGTGKYHGSASEYYQYEGLNARGEYGPPLSIPQDKYHTNNASFTLGGPVPHVTQLFFFVAFNPYHTITPTSTYQTFETNPAFITTYMENSGAPSLEVQTMLQPYNQPSPKFLLLDQTNPVNYSTAAQIFNGGYCPPSGFLSSSYLGVPCNTVVAQAGLFNATSYTNAKQYSFRIDKVFSKDRVYVSFFRSTLYQNNSAIIPTNSSYDNEYSYALQGNETHTFSPNLVNEAIVGFTRTQGILTQGNYYYSPSFSIADLPSSYGNGIYQDVNYVTRAERYRDVLRYIRGTHSFSFGAEAVHTSNPAQFATCFGIPVYYFYDPLDAATDLPDIEYGLSYNYATGESAPYQYGFATTTFGLFAEDTWKATRRLTVNYGLRYDNYGNPYPVTVHGPVTTETLLSTIRLAGGSESFQQQIANAHLVPSSHSFSHDLNWNFNPRVGFAYDPRGNGKWVVRGGFGVYHDWYNLGAATDGASINPPNAYEPTFERGITATQPLFSVGTPGDLKYPFGYTYPTISGAPLDPNGGILGGYAPVAGPDRNLKTPTTLNWSLGVERQLLPQLTVSLGYTGSHSYNQLYGGQSGGTSEPGVDVNVFDGDTIQHPEFNGNSSWNKGFQSRLNPSFGSMDYSFNGARASYEALTVGVRGRFGKHGFLNASYTHSNANDDWQTSENGYQADGAWNTNRQYGPSNLDVRNRVSVAASYQLPGLTRGNGVLRRVLSGYGLSTTVRLQSGEPFTVGVSSSLNLIDTVPGTQLTSANYQSELAAGNVTYITPANYNSANVQAALAAGDLASSSISGDYSGDGSDYATPNVLSYAQKHGRSVYKYKCPVSQSGCAGSVQSSQFAAPAFNAGGTEGNEKFNQFRNPGSADVDLTVVKNTVIKGHVNLELRLDFFNALNRVNWNALDSNLADYTTSFGTTQGAGAARVGQLGAKITF